MRRNNSSSGLGRNHFSSRGVPAPARKVEGFDLRATLSPPCRTEPQMNPNYRSSIESLKSRTRTKDLEDEYIKGLQEQIKFLEYELKLLKDKELQQQSTVEHLGKFFDDGVPLNENILAMKNRFTSQKHEFEERCRTLKAECKQKQDLIGSVKTEIDRLKDLYRSTESEKQQRQDQLVGQVAALSRKLKQYLHQGRLAEDQQRELEVKHKKVEDELARIKLNGEMEGVLSKEDVRNGQISLIKVHLQEKDREIGRLEAERESLRSKVEQNTVIAQMQANNTELKKRILLTTKEVNLLSTKVDEARFECDNRLKERQLQAAQKRQLQAKVQQLKKQIDEENKLTEEDMESRIAEREKNEIRAIERKKQSLTKYINFKKQETEKLQAETQEILAGKADLQQKLATYAADVERLTNKLATQRQRQVQLISEIEALQTSQRILDSVRQPLPTQNAKLTERIQTLQKDTQRLRRDNALKERQLQLIRELRSFNLDELKLIRNTSSTVQENIASFLKKWQSIRPHDQ